MSDGTHIHPHESGRTSSRGEDTVRLRTRLSDLPSLPDVPQTLATLNPLATDATYNDTYVEFDLSSMLSTQLRPLAAHSGGAEGVERVIDSSRSASVSRELLRLDEKVVFKHPVDSEVKAASGTFFDEPNWSDMKVVADTDYYDERGNLEFPAAPDALNKTTSHGYTRIDTEEQVAKYLELDKKTDFLFRVDYTPRQASSDIPQYRPEDAEYTAKRDISIDHSTGESNSDSDSDFEGELHMMDSKSTLQSTRDMLLDSQKFAYVGGVKVIMRDMATELVKLTQYTSRKVAQPMSASHKNFSNWTMYIMSKLNDHMEFTPEERTMIENVSKHGLEASDLLRDLFSEQNATTNKHNSISQKKKNIPGFDLKWVIVCDLFLLLLSDGYYDSRSNTLLLHFAHSAGIDSLEILQFQRRLIDNLQLEVTEKSIENKDDMLNDRQFIDKHTKRNKARRAAYIGLAAVGGSLAIGLSAGLLAPVIGAGIAAGLTTVGITGTAGFLAGVGGTAIITTSGVAVGARVGSRAGANRTGEVKTFEFKPLHNNKRTNLIITVSGWMNGHHDDVRLPFSTVDPVMGDMFSLLWEPEMLRSMGQTISILATEALTTSIQQILGATILTALMLALQLPMILSKLSYLLDNPWNVSLDRAWKAGVILADTLVSGNMGVRPITLVGFSLGARLIYSCLIELAKRGAFGLIENVILLGMPIVVKPDQMALARSVVSGKFANGYSKKDWILGYLFRATGGGLQTVAGLSPIDKLHGVQNIDCTDWVDGHMAYRKAIPEILSHMNWEVLSQEFTEIEEPDVEQGKRARQLVDEFDEARAKLSRESQNQQNTASWKRWLTPKPKNWWDIAGKSATTKPKDAESLPETEYDEHAERPNACDNQALFDVNALQQQVQDIERVADVATPVSTSAIDVAPNGNSRSTEK